MTKQGKNNDQMINYLKKKTELEFKGEFID